MNLLEIIMAWVVAGVILFTIGAVGTILLIVCRPHTQTPAEPSRFTLDYWHQSPSTPKHTARVAKEFAEHLPPPHTEADGVAAIREKIAERQAKQAKQEAETLQQEHRGMGEVEAGSAPSEGVRIGKYFPEEHSTPGKAETLHLPYFGQAEPLNTSTDRSSPTGSSTWVNGGFLPHQATIERQAAQQIPPRSDRELVYGFRAVCWAHPIEEYLIAPWMGDFHQEDSRIAWFSAALDRAQHENEEHGRAEALADLTVDIRTI